MLLFFLKKNTKFRKSEKDKDRLYETSAKREKWFGYFLTKNKDFDISVEFIEMLGIIKKKTYSCF